VAQRRDVPFGEVVLDEADLVRFVYNGRQSIRVRLAGAAFGSIRAQAPAAPDQVISG
jgi:hypothetical protein